MLPALSSPPLSLSLTVAFFNFSWAAPAPRFPLSTWLLSVCVLQCWPRLWRRLVDDAEKFTYIPDSESEDDADVAESEEYEDDE